MGHWLEGEYFSGWEKLDHVEMPVGFEVTWKCGGRAEREIDCRYKESTQGRHIRCGRHCHTVSIFQLFFSRESSLLQVLDGQVFWGKCGPCPGHRCDSSRLR